MSLRRRGCGRRAAGRRADRRCSSLQDVADTDTPGTMGLPVRRAGRVIVLDPADRVLLMRYDDPLPNGRHWTTPGGGLERRRGLPGRGRPRAGRGDRLDRLALLGEVHERSLTMGTAGRLVRQHERHVPGPDRPAPPRAGRRRRMHASDGIAAWRWWSSPNWSPPRRRSGQPGWPDLIRTILSRWPPNGRRQTGGAPMEPMPEDWARAVAVVAHPDDLEYGAAAAVARWTSQGKHVAYLLATRGEAGIAGQAPDEVAPLREEEERRSAAVVGVTTCISSTTGRAGGVRPAAAPRPGRGPSAERPDIVITMNFELTWGDSNVVNHADHRAVGLAVLDACRDAANSWVFPEAGPAGTASSSVGRGDRRPHALRGRHGHDRGGRRVAARAPGLPGRARPRFRPGRVPPQHGRVPGHGGGL